MLSPDLNHHPLFRRMNWPTYQKDSSVLCRLISQVLNRHFVEKVFAGNLRFSTQGSSGLIALTLIIEFMCKLLAKLHNHKYYVI